MFKYNIGDKLEATPEAGGRGVSWVIVEERHETVGGRSYVLRYQDHTGHDSVAVTPLPQYYVEQVYRKVKAPLTFATGFYFLTYGGGLSGPYGADNRAEAYPGDQAKLEMRADGTFKVLEDYRS